MSRLPESEVAEVARESLITPEGLEKLKRSSRSSDRRSGARSPSGSRRRASSATSPRTPSTTTPRTSRRCSSSGSRSSRERLRRATVIDQKDLDTDDRLGRRQGPRQGPEVGRLAKFQLVGSAEADPAQEKLSNESPIGKALIGRKSGEVVRSSPERPEEEAEDHQDRGRLAPHRTGDVARLACTASPRQRATRRARRASSRDRAPREARAPARAAGVDPFPHDFAGPRRRSPRCARAHEGLDAGRGDRARHRVAGRIDRPPRPRQGRVPRPPRRQRPDPAPLARGRARRRGTSA